MQSVAGCPRACRRATAGGINHTVLRLARPARRSAAQCGQMCILGGAHKRAAHADPTNTERGSTLYLKPAGRSRQQINRRYQRFLPSITTTGASAATKSSNRRALTPMRRVRLSQLPSDAKAGLSVNVPQPHTGQK